jgi:uncharacterized membrane protein
MRNRKKEDTYGPVAGVVVAFICVVVVAFSIGRMNDTLASMDKRIYQLEQEIQKHQEVLSSIGKRLR